MLFNGDCLEVMKTLDDKSVDLVFCDLPYGQTSCKWDCKIDLQEFWKQIMRIKKLNTPIFFTTTTKFGVELIQSAPKKCFFRYDLVWVKSAAAGFLSAKKMPMRKHEMIYVFYEKLPLYDLSRHKHKFKTISKPSRDKNSCYGTLKEETSIKYDPPLPNSVVKEQEGTVYGDLPTTDSYAESVGINKADKHKVHYDPPLPNSVVKEPEPEPEPEATTGECYGNQKRDLEQYKDCGKKGKNQVLYDPPLPSSVIKKVERKSTYGDIETHDLKTGKNNATPRYDPPLPHSMLEIKSTRGKHSTEKPVALMEWILSYYSKEGDVVLDPTMGSGSTGVACKNLKRKFIGIEMDAEIFEVAKSRNPDELVKA